MTSKHYMTKTIVLGEQREQAVKKPIEFYSLITVADSDDVDVEPIISKPYEWNYIELVSKNYAPNIDLLFAYNDPNDRGSGLLIIGRWNDGFVVK